MNKELPVVALFDFDGTITTRDSLLPFLFYLYGFWGVARIGILSFPKLCGFFLNKTSRQDVKEAILTAAFQGKTPVELLQKAADYANGSLNKLVKPKALEKIEWHQKMGHRCVIVSASISLYLNFWIQQHGAFDLLCSELALDSSGCYTGKLIGKNCWGPEKVSRIDQLLKNRNQFTLYAYGDSRGDKEMLEYADYPFFNRWD